MKTIKGVTVRCLKCGREYPGQKKNCIYCGASLKGEAPQEINYTVDNENNIFVSEKENREVEFRDLPEHIRHKIEDTIRNGKKKVIIKEERSVIQPLSTDAGQKPALSLEKVLALLSEMKDSFNEGNIEYIDYERLVSDIMKDYLATLDDNIRVDFVVNEIKNSKIYDYLDDRMLKKLRTFVISSVSAKRGSPEGVL